MKDRGKKKMKNLETFYVFEGVAWLGRVHVVVEDNKIDIVEVVVRAVREGRGQWVNYDNINEEAYAYGCTNWEDVDNYIEENYEGYHYFDLSSYDLPNVLFNMEYLKCENSEVEWYY